MERFRIHSGDRIALAVKERNVVIERLKHIEESFANVFLIQNNFSIMDEVRWVGLQGLGDLRATRE